jgi:hypothetical protein
MLYRLKILLWFPFVIFYFPMLVLLGKDNTDDIGDWIIDI